MRKFIIAGMALAVLAIIPSAASADVARCEASVPTKTVIKTATFTATQPYGQVGQWDSLWTHNYTVTIDPETGTFAGVGEVSGPGGVDAFPETITGSINTDGTVLSYTATRTVNLDVRSYSLVNAVTDGTTISNPTTSPATDWTIEMKVSKPVITTSETTTPGTESVKNHGQFVKAQSGGKTAAQACAGMPLNSTQGGGFLK
jgi:hypothetical protein